MFTKVLRSQTGQSIIAVIVLVDAIILGALVFYNHYSTQQADARMNFVRRFLLEETTQSSFAVMEAALRRRLWEAPPDNRCLKSENFFVTGETPGCVLSPLGRRGNCVSWRVDVKYNPRNKVYEMVAAGSSQGLKVSYRKQVKVVDASSFLILNASENPLLFYRSYENSDPVGLIAKDKRIYSKGRFQFVSQVHRSINGTDASWTSMASKWPDEYGIIFQGERISVARGMQYAQTIPIYTPSDFSSWSTAVRNLLDSSPGGPYYSDFPGDFVTPVQYRGQYASGHAIFTENWALAEKMANDVRTKTDTMSSAEKAAIKRQVYPAAMFSGSARPLLGNNATDNGGYINDPDRWPIFHYYFSANNFGTQMNGICLVDHNLNPDYYFSCSDSELWPKGFSKWRKDAGLEGVVETKETVNVDTQPLDWDNFAALEEDARACGAIVENSTPGPSTYEDCQIWDKRSLDAWLGIGSPVKCPSVNKVNLDSVPLANFDEDVLADDDQQDRLMRRVIYAKSPTEFAQTDQKGFRSAWGNTTEGKKKRSRFSLWLVGEGLLNLRGFQKDTTSPLASDLEKRREVVFNADVSGDANPLRPLQMVMLAPDSVHLLSPYYKPISASHWNTLTRVESGKIYWKRGFMYDWDRWEDDAYKFGMRSFRVEGMALLANARGWNDNGFFLKGLWSTIDSGPDQFIRNQCLVQVPGTKPNMPVPAGIDSTIRAYKDASGNYQYGDYVNENGYYPIPVNGPGNTIPPDGSRYYYYDATGTRMPKDLGPNVFEQQYLASPTGDRKSALVFNGLQLMMEFDSTVPPGKYSLRDGKYEPIDMYEAADMPDRQFLWNTNNWNPAPAPFYWTQVGPDASGNGKTCTRANALRLDGHQSAWLFQQTFKVNEGRFTFQHSAPKAEITNVGSLFGTELPLLQSRE